MIVGQTLLDYFYEKLEPNLKHDILRNQASQYLLHGNYRQCRTAADKIFRDDDFPLKAHAISSVYQCMNVRREHFNDQITFFETLKKEYAHRRCDLARARHSAMLRAEDEGASRDIPQ